MQPVFIEKVFFPSLCWGIGVFLFILFFHWLIWKNVYSSEIKYENKKYPLGLALIISLSIAAFIGADVGFIIQTGLTKPGKYIAFSGQVVNSGTNKWPDDRLVLLFLKGNEVARDTTSPKAVKGNDLGVVDGNFYVETKNPYELNTYLVDSEILPYQFKSTIRWLDGQILYSWLGQIEEGSTIHIPITSENIEYVIKILQGNINSLPLEMLQAGSTRLRDDGQIIVALPGSVKADGSQTSGIFVDDITYATKTQPIEINKLTVPINNCAGSVEVSQKYTQTQTFIHQYTSEVGVNIGVEIPLADWATLLPNIQVKYGFENGQIDTRTVEYNMAAAPGTNVVYVVTWSEVWESGAAKVTNGNDTIAVPFRVKTNLIYDIASEPRNCP